MVIMNSPGKLKIWYLIWKKVHLNSASIEARIRLLPTTGMTNSSVRPRKGKVKNKVEN